MRLYLDFIDGPEKGKRLSISAPTNLGRKGAEIAIDDPKLSEIHAYFEISPDAEWIIRDNNSRNGVWVNGLKETKTILKDGDQLQIGSSLAVCRTLKKAQSQYSDKIQQGFYDLLKKIKNEKNSLVEVKPEMRLKFIQGQQYGHHWDIFYGPRTAGKDHIDLCLFDEAAPSNAFEVHVKGKYPYFFTLHKDVVRLNNESIESKQLTPGDIISIGETQLLVEFDEGHGFRS